MIGQIAHKCLINTKHILAIAFAYFLLTHQYANPVKSAWRIKRSGKWICKRLDLVRLFMADGLCLDLRMEVFTDTNTADRTPKEWGGRMLPGWVNFEQVTPAAVPVPAAVWLFGSALIGFIGMSRRINP